MMFTLVVVLSLLKTVQSKPPHIVFIVADDLGYHDLGFRGTRIKTPTLDGLAKEGVVLNEYYVQPVCSPSRAAFNTGRYPIRYGMQHYVLPSNKPEGLNLSETLLPQRLKEAGYSTHAVGKVRMTYTCLTAATKGVI
jgi:arylsulfatase A-like enzyme